VKFKNEIIKIQHFCAVLEFHSFMCRIALYWPRVGTHLQHFVSADTMDLTKFETSVLLSQAALRY
jgi:hypothetical protein